MNYLPCDGALRAWLEDEFGDRIKFTYLDIDDPQTEPFKKALGYVGTPQFVLLMQRGNHNPVVWIGRSGRVRKCLHRGLQSVDKISLMENNNVTTIRRKRALITAPVKALAGDCCPPAEYGASVIAISRTQADLDLLKAEIDCQVIQADLSDVDQARVALWRRPRG